jgi:hypothetical protein
MEISNQFPAPLPVTTKPTVGTLWYFGLDKHWREMATNSPFWFIQQQKRNLVMRGFDRKRFRITY